MEQKIKESFFTKDPTFFRTLFPLLITVALQNIVAYSVNMADNIMLGSYSQNALSGAATVNQIFFMVQQITLGIGEDNRMRYRDANASARRWFRKLWGN